MDRLAALALAGIASVVVLILLKASVIAFNLACFHARPELCDRAHRIFVERPWRAAAAGVANTAVMAILALILLQIQPLALLGIGLAALLCAIHIWGRIAYYQVLEDRLGGGEAAAPGVAPWLRGAIIAELSFLVPVLGQVLFLAVTMRCAGAFIIAVLSRPRESAP